MKQTTTAMDRSRRLMTLACGVFFLVVVIADNNSISILVANPQLAPDGLHHQGPYDPRKVAILIENRAMPHLAALLLHFTFVIPPEWRVRFMGSEESFALMNSTRAVRYEVELGKMDLTYIPSNMSVDGSEQISTFLTNLWVYETLLQPAEWLLVFHTDSMLCANSNRSLNDWLDYDWVGAPWNINDRYGGNGGLSLRRVSAVINILQNQRRLPNSAAEDVWLSRRLGQRVGAKVANATLEVNFSGEGFFSDNPMGYHLGASGKHMPAENWGNPIKRQAIYDYCPEIKMILAMDLAEYIKGDCGSTWSKRDGDEAMYDLIPW